MAQQREKKPKQIPFFSLETEDLLYLIFEFCGISSLPNVLTTCRYWLELFYRQETLENLFILQAFRLFYWIQKGYPCIQYPSASFVSQQYLQIFKQYPTQPNWYTIELSLIWDENLFKARLPLLEKCFDCLLVNSADFANLPPSIQKIIDKRKLLVSYSCTPSDSVYHFNIPQLVPYFMNRYLSSKDVAFFEQALIHPNILSDYTIFDTVDEEILKLLIKKGATVQNIEFKIQQFPHLKFLILGAATAKERSIFNYNSDPQNKQYILDFIQHGSEWLSFYNSTITTNKFYLKNLIYFHPKMILQMPADERTKALIVTALSRDGMLLKQLSKAEQKSIECVEAAVRNNPDAFEFAKEKLRADENLILFLLKEQPKVMKYAHSCLLQNRYSVMKFIKVNPNCFEFLLAEHKADLEIVKHCLSHNPMLLEFVDDSLRNDPQIVTMATAKKSKAFQFAGDEIKDDEHFVISILKWNGLLLKYASKNLRKNVTVAHVAVEENPLALEFVLPPAIQDKDLVSKAIHLSPIVAKFVSDKQ